MTPLDRTPSSEDQNAFASGTVLSSRNTAASQTCADLQSALAEAMCVTFQYRVDQAAFAKAIGHFCYEWMDEQHRYDPAKDDH